MPVNNAVWEFGFLLMTSCNRYLVLNALFALGMPINSCYNREISRYSWIRSS